MLVPVAIAVISTPIRGVWKTANVARLMSVTGLPPYRTRAVNGDTAGELGAGPGAGPGVGPVPVVFVGIGAGLGVGLLEPSPGAGFTAIGVGVSVGVGSGVTQVIWGGQEGGKGVGVGVHVPPGA